MEAIVPVVLAGGNGSRLWPLSRSSSPKQLLNIFGENTLLQETLLRCKKITEASPIIIYNKNYHFQVAEQVESIGFKSARYMIEPVAKNTCPAITLAALEAQNNDEDPFLLFMPADHFFLFEENRFLEQISLAKSVANRGFLITFGVIPRAAETGYGYIQKGEALLENEIFTVKNFIEKPEKVVAESYIKDQDFLWNSGMFFFRASTFIAELSEYAPEVLQACKSSYAGKKYISGCTHVDTNFYTCPAISIDYAVMEHTKVAAVIPVNAQWSDIGSWSSIYDLQEKDLNGNVLQGDVLIENSKNCYIRSSHRLVATVGLEDHIVVETRDSVLIAHKDKSQEIRAIVQKLTELNRPEAADHYYVVRPWGAYEVLIDLPNYKVKRLCVKKGSSLSLQRHKHRSEHWVIVSGVATIVNGEEHLVLYPSQSTYIPQGAKHRLSNFSDQLLELIEVQIGDYLGEDDIERFEDIYGRNEEVFSTSRE